MAWGGDCRPASRFAHSGEKAINPRGLGTESPFRETVFSVKLGMPGPDIWRVVRSFVGRLGLALCIGTVGLCGVLHIATFMTIVPFLWLLPPFFLMAGAVL